MTGEYLLKRIRVAGFSNKKIAEELGISPQSVGDMKNNNSIGSERMEEICRIIGKPINFLYEGYKENLYTYMPESIKTTPNIGVHQGENGDLLELTKMVAELQKRLLEKDEMIERLLFRANEVKVHDANFHH